jgi:hypothetical protein
MFLILSGSGIAALGCAGIPFVEGIFSLGGAGAGITNPEQARHAHREHIGARVFVGGVVTVGVVMIAAGVMSIRAPSRDSIARERDSAS